jgi:hypothetical protein
LAVNTGKFRVFLTTGILVLAVGCRTGTGPKETAQDTTKTGHGTLDPAKATASIRGRVTFAGPAPNASEIDMRSDPSCAAAHSEPQYTDEIVVSDGNLQNVFVWVKEGLEGYVFETPSNPVTIEQVGCRYRPHVGGIMVNQKLVILNSDSTLHNILCVAGRNPSFNIGQPVQGMTSEKTFPSPEVMVRFKCNVHKWMISYFGVVPHPYFAVTGKDGTFTFKNLPPGGFVLEAWHEKLGARTQKVEVSDKETREADFSFTPSL